jgi:hypothetical protein
MFWTVDTDSDEELRYQAGVDFQLREALEDLVM